MLFCTKFWLLYIPLSGVDIFRAWELFEASVASNHLVGSRCETLALMSTNRCVGPTEVMGGNEYVKWS